MKLQYQLGIFGWGPLHDEDKALPLLMFRHTELYAIGCHCWRTSDHRKCLYVYLIHLLYCFMYFCHSEIKLLPVYLYNYN